MEKNITESDFDEINTLVNSIVKRNQDIRNKRQSYEIELSEKIRKTISEKESEIVHLKNQHNLEVDQIKTEFQNEIEKAKSDHKTEITQIKTNTKPNQTK